MSVLSQEERTVAIHTPLGTDVLLVTGFKGAESLSSLFEFRVDLISEKHDIPFEQIIGEKAALSIMLADGAERYIHGLVAEFSQGRGGGDAAGSDALFSYYHMKMVPWPWLLTHTADSRIFQELTAPDIIEQIFSEKGFTDYSNRLTAAYNTRTYCVQYRETDFNFVARLMEEEGIHFFFEHEKDKHILVMADSGTEHAPCPHQERARYQISGGGWLEQDVITRFEIKKQIQPNKYSLVDYNFEIPGTNLEVEAPARNVLGKGEREIYDHPGGYGSRDQGDKIAEKRMEMLEAQITTVNGASECRAFVTGYRFRISDHYRSDVDGKEFVLESLVHRFSGAGNYPRAGVAASEAAYENQFVCILHDVPYRPPLKTHKPRIHSAQTAIVTGPPGEEIYTDKHGRVKVQFHWDREGKHDENTTCWIRVSQGWAGAGWGAMYIPRIGHEVIISFIEGDPDRPIITGRVYHGSNTPPYSLPGEKTKSTLKSESSLGGGGYNEIRFEDKKGEEEVFFHAQKDENTIVENDQTIYVGHDRSEQIKRDRSLLVERDKSEKILRNKSIQVINQHMEQIGGTMNIVVAKTLTENVGINYAETVGGAMEITVGGALAVTVGAASAETVAGVKSVAIGGSKSESIGAGKSLNIGKDLNETIKDDRIVKIDKNLKEEIGKQHEETVGKEYILKAQKIQMVAKDQILIKTGRAEIIMKKNGDITIKGKKINVKGSGDVVIKGSKIKEN